MLAVAFLFSARGPMTQADFAGSRRQRSPTRPSLSRDSSPSNADRNRRFTTHHVFRHHTKCSPRSRSSNSWAET